MNKCFMCKYFEGISGMDALCKKWSRQKGVVYNSVSLECLAECEKNNWFRR